MKYLNPLWLLGYVCGVIFASLGEGATKGFEVIYHKFNK